jgi:O-antigen/teichoic acid export membrane protein
VASPARNVAFAFLQRYLSFGLQLGTSIILARLLSPGETGVFSLAAAAVAVGSIVREFGITDYLVSRSEVGAPAMRAAYGAACLVSWGVAAVLWIIAPWLADWYAEPGVRHVIHLLSVNFMLLPLGTVGLAMMTKRMQFDRIFWVMAPGQLIGAATTVACAYGGASYASPAWGGIAATVATMTALAVAEREVVFLRPSLLNIGEVLAFGCRSAGARLVEGICLRSDDFIVSRMLGFHSTGILSKANSLNAGFYTFFASAIVSVAYPMLAKARHEGKDLPAEFKRLTVLIAAPQFTFYALLSVCSAEVIGVLFGDAWMDAVPVLVIGALQGAICAPFMLCTAMLNAFGAVGALLKLNLLFGFTLVSAIYLGAMHGLVWVAAFALMAHVLRQVLIVRVTRQVTGIAAWRVVPALASSVLIGVAAGGMALLVRYAVLLNGGHRTVVLVASLGAGTLAALVAGLLLRHPIVAEVRHRLRRR